MGKAPDEQPRHDPLGSRRTASIISRLIDTARGGENLSEPEFSALIGELGLDGADASALRDRVHGAREEANALRVRRQELTALADSARILAEATDVAETLDHIVRLARNLVVSDFTYLSEFDPQTGELRPRAVNGILSAQFATLVVPDGFGLASLVARTRAPQTLDRYTDSDLVRSHPDVAAAVADEGIVSLLGVPLQAHGTVLGVLFAGTRTAHHYSRDEIAILTALADHASIALRRSYALGDLYRSGEEASAERARFEELFADQRLASEVGDILAEQVLLGTDVHGALAGLSQAVSRTLLLVDASGTVLADSAHRGESKAVNALVRGVVTAAADAVSTDAARYVALAEPAGAEGYVSVTTRSAGRLHLVVERARDSEVALNAETVVSGAHTCAFAWLLQGASRMRTDRLRDDLFADMMDGSHARAAVRAHFAELGWEAGTPLTLTSVGGASQDLLALRATLSGARTPGVFTAMHDGVLALVSPEVGAGEVHAAVEARMRRMGGLVASATPIGTQDEGRLAGLAQGWRDNGHVLRTLRALGWGGEVVPASLALPFVTVAGADRGAFDAFIDTTIGPVLRSDAENGTQLFDTLHSFFDADRNVRRAATETAFHVNTVSQRLARVDALLPFSWRHAPQSFLVEAAVRLARLDRRLRR